MSAASRVITTCILQPANLKMSASKIDMSKFDLDPGMYEYPKEIWHCEGFPREAVNAAKTFKFRDTDILAATYPKTGQYYKRTI